MDGDLRSVAQQPVKSGGSGNYEIGWLSVGEIRWLSVGEILQNAAENFLIDLRERLAQFELELNEEKTVITDLTKGKNGIFHFLGLSFYWARRCLSSQLTLSVKTQKSRLHKKIQDFYIWIKSNRNKTKARNLWEDTRAKLLGHYNYYGYFCNRRSLWHYYTAIMWSLFNWLNRRSQKQSFTWERFKHIASRQGLPTPPRMNLLKTIGRKAYAKS